MNDKNTIYYGKNNIEIERKFLFQGLMSDLNFKRGQRITQSYIFMDKEKELRIRISNNACVLSIKINREQAVREEFEYKIPIKDGERLIEIASYPPIEKIRYVVTFDKIDWEIDVFQGENEGLVIVELELNDLDQAFSKPSWVGNEVTTDQRYYNSYIYRNPYKNWTKFN